MSACMMNVSTAQALNLWTEFERGFRGESSHGGRVSEIYGYTLMPYTPGVHREVKPEPGSIFYEDRLQLTREAAEALRELLLLFEQTHDCVTFVELPDGRGWVRPSAWTDQYLEHRVHVWFRPDGDDGREP